MHLDSKQMEIVNSNEPQILVIAGSGSGKTRVLTERIKRLINDGVPTDGIVVITFTNAAADEIKERLEYVGEAFIGTIHGYANRILLRNGINTKEYIEKEDFDQFFQIIKARKVPLPYVEHLLVDEYQDVDPRQFEFFKLLSPANFFAVGDDWQCQPVGTKIWLRNNIIKNIEEVDVGDSVVYYDSNGGRCSGLTSKSGNSIIKKVQAIETHFTDERIITITTKNNLYSSYTPGHRTYVRIHNKENLHTVYLMCDNNYRFRVGKIQLGTGANHKHNSWRRKMQDEGCEKIWLLGIYHSDKEARVEEAKISYKYGIPQSCWQVNKVSWSEEDINYIYADIPIKERSEKCLQDYGLDIKYPFHDSSIDWMVNNHFAGNGSVLIYASNIIPEYMSALCYDKNHSNNHSNKKYELITKREDVVGKRTQVCSLKVEGGNYVADGIVTHNSIYSFRGSDVSIFLDLAHDKKTKVFYLETNYRSGAEIIDFANHFIEPVQSKIEKGVYCVNYGGEVITMKSLNLDFILDTILSVDSLQDWFIITRTNAQIDMIIDFLQKNEIPCETFKKSELDNHELRDKLKANTIKVLTAHSAKGLENKNVVALGIKPYWDEERRVAYVAATRAMNLLIWVFSTKQPQKKNNIEVFEF